MGKKEFDEFVSGITKQRIASICLALGWNSVHQSSMEIMQDLMIRYIRMLGTGAQARAELCNRTESNVMDLQSLFDDINVNLGELEEYVEKVDDRALVTDQVPNFPAASKTDLNFLKPGSQEVLHRKTHIEHYFPPMYPELEKEEDDVPGIGSISDGTTGVKVESGSENNLSGNVSPTGLGGGGRTLTEKEAELNPFREMDSVMMTAGGFISPAREGRLPEALRPAVSALATASIPQELDTATPPSTPTPPPINQANESSNSSVSTKPTPKKRGPVPGSKHKKKKETISHKISNADDSGDDLSGDETYEPPPGTVLTDNSSSKKLSVFQRKVNKPRKPSPTKHVDSLNSSTESISNYSDVHVDDIIQNVIERGIKESSRAEGPLSASTQKSVAANNSISGGQPAGQSKNDLLPSQAQTPKSISTNKIQNVPHTGPKKRGRKKKSELLRLEAEKAALDASKSESSDVDICYDAPIRKKPRLDNTTLSAVPPAQLKVPQAPITPPDASILLNNPLIPKVPYGFGDLGSFNVPTAMEEGEIMDTSPERPSSGARSFDLITSPEHLKDFGSNANRHGIPLDKHEKKKEKSGKKSKKDKKDKDKNRERDKNKDKFKKEDKKDKKERNKELRREKKREEKERLREERRERKREEKERERKEKKKKKLMKKPNVEMPPLFAPAAEVLPVVQSQPKVPPKVPTIKIKEIKPDDNKPKHVENISNVKNPHFIKTKEPSEDFTSFSIHQKDKKQKSTKKKDKSLESPYPQEIEPLKIHISKKISKHEKRERASSGDIQKRKIKDIQPFSHGPSNPELGDVDPGASSSNSPQISGISSPSSFVGGGTITTQTVGKYVDQDGREIWICPGCGKQDDGSPMIGCDSCDDWYHWVCVNIHQEPADEDWFCPRCRARKSGAFLPTPQGQQPSKRSLSASAGRRGRPPKGPKM